MAFDHGLEHEAEDLAEEAKGFARHIGLALHATGITAAQEDAIFEQMIVAYVEERFKKGDIDRSGYKVFEAAARMEPPCSWMMLPSIERINRRDDLAKAIEAYSEVSAEDVAAARGDYLFESARDNVVQISDARAK